MYTLTLGLVLYFQLASGSPAQSTWSRIEPGCGIDHSAIAGHASFNSSIMSSGGNRTFLVHVPANYNKNKQTGLVLSYHGNSRNASYQESLSQFSNATFNQDWIAVYPQGDHWEGPTYATRGVSDLQFTSDLLDYMRQNYCIDDSRIYATGKSNGGGFVGTLACNAVGGNFAAFAPVSGAFYTDANSSSVCTPARSPLPILEFHGYADTTIPYAGGRGAGGPLPSIPSWLRRWAKRDGCSGTPPPNTTTIEYGGVVRHSSWSCAGYDGIVQGYNISGLGHTWPSTAPNLDNKGNVTVIDATAVIMDFFRQHTKP